MNQSTQTPGNIPAQAKVHLTDRQLKYHAFIMEGKSKVEAARLAGYDEDTNSAVIERSPSLRNALMIAMEARGLTTDYLADKLMKGTNSKKTQFYSYEGIVTDQREVEDNEIQHRYVKTALEIRGDLAENNATQVNIGLITVPQSQTVNEWNEK